MCIRDSFDTHDLPDYETYDSHSCPWCRPVSYTHLDVYKRQAIARMEGTTCGRKPTCCPDQIAQALKGALAEMG